ncbi:MAG: monooxygenase family protein [Pseudonocardiaceae bacterium]
MQYWRSTEDLLAFASDSHAPHAVAWREFNRRISASGAVGVWHETYAVVPGGHECIYVNMPLFRLAAATRYVLVGPGTTSAATRLRRPGPRTPGSMARRACGS